MNVDIFKLLTILSIGVSRIFAKLYSFVMLCGLRMRGMRGGKGLSIMRRSSIGNWLCNVKMGRNVSLHKGVRITVARDSSLIIKDRVTISHYTIIMVSRGTTIVIGKNGMIGGHCVIVSADHDISDKLSVKDSGFRVEDIVIGDNCWIGANCVITKGVTIGDGSIIGAGSVVTKDIPPMSVAIGSPAKVIKKREIKNV